MSTPLSSAQTPLATPRRVQRLRVRGWRMPRNTVYVGRPTVFGNPFIVGATTPATWPDLFATIVVRDAVHAVGLFSDYLAWRRRQPAGWTNPAGPRYPWDSQIALVLRGRDLACWCRLDQPCHADVLLQLAAEQEARP